MAMATRCSQAVAGSRKMRTNTYVDDPILAVAGTPTQRTTRLALTFLIWMAFGFTLAWQKGQRGQRVTWISGILHVTPPGIVASLKEDLLTLISLDLDSFLMANRIAKKKFRTFVGRCVHAASLLVVWRPFVAMLWGALSGRQQHQGQLWTRQVAVPLRWLRCFLDGQAGKLRRHFIYSTYADQDDEVALILDASPWGLGGVLALKGQMVSFFADTITEEDCATLHIEKGSHRGQQACEALAVLVALRLWAPVWANRRVFLAVRSDSVAAITLLIHCKAMGPRCSLISREAALDIADGGVLAQRRHAPAWSLQHPRRHALAHC